jgi:hypothetical protein
MRRLFEHRGKPEDLAHGRFIDDHFLAIFVHRGDADLARDHHVGLPAGRSHLVNPFPRRKCLELDLAGEDRGFIVIQQGEERHTLE